MRGGKREIGAYVLVAAALAAAAGAAGVVVVGSRGPRHMVELALVVGLAVTAVVLGALGVNMIASARRTAAGEEVAPADYRHARTLFLVLAGVAAVAIVARGLAVPETFGAYGGYRGAAPFEAMNEREPRHLGEAACGTCHAEQVKLHDKDAHASVPCETCHGAGWQHAKSPAEVKLRVPTGQDFCLGCHRRLAARPGGFAQIEVAKHYAAAGVTNLQLECARCHDPHEPLFMDRDLRTARLHPIIHRCGDCHVGREDEGQARPAGHPAIFQCKDCHGKIATDFASKPHAAKVSCTTCHVFVKESEFAGRIVRDADPRFCLLCHRKAEFRGAGAPPSVEWPEHRAEMGGPEDAQKRCIDCHQQDYIHTVQGEPNAQ